jgi:hypothetical protein
MTVYNQRHRGASVDIHIRLPILASSVQQVAWVTLPMPRQCVLGATITEVNQRGHAVILIVVSSAAMPYTLANLVECS